MSALNRRRKNRRSLPTTEQLQAELNRERYKKRTFRMFRSAICTLITVTAVAVLVTNLVFPVLRIYGNSMAPTLNEEDLVVVVKRTELCQGDVVAFNCDNRILVKRVIALPGSCVDIDTDGNVTVDGFLLDEPYLTEKALGETDLTLPCQVPDGQYFVMGDHRSTSVDSRSAAVGFVAEEQVVGKIIFRLWPLDGIGTVH